MSETTKELERLVEGLRQPEGSDAFISAVGRTHDLAPALAAEVLAGRKALTQAREALAAAKNAILIRTPRSVSCLLCRYALEFDGEEIEEHRPGCAAPEVARALAALGKEATE